MSIVHASYLFSGFGDYFNGYGCEDNQALLYAFYGPRSTLRDVINSAVDDADCSAYDIPETVTDDMIRDAIVNNVLNDRGRADYECDAISEWAETYADINGYNVCRECGQSIDRPHYSDCAMIAEELENGDIDEDDYLVEDSDCKDEDDCDGSPVVVFLIEWGICSICGKVAECNVDNMCEECLERITK